MTYCVGILIRDGLVLAADSRSNAGLDHIATVRSLPCSDRDTAPGVVMCSRASAPTSRPGCTKE
jgi:putative proteasome-type protease